MRGGLRSAPVAVTPDREVYVLCITTAAYPTPGTASVVMPCQVCGVQVWLSFATYDDLRDRNLFPEPVCPHCFAGLAGEDGATPLVPGPRTRAAVRRARWPR